MIEGEYEKFPSILNATNMRELWIRTPLNEIPDEIGKLRELRTFIVSNKSASFDKLPDSIAGLKNLKTLQLGNNITSIPDSIAELKNL